VVLRTGEQVGQMALFCRCWLVRALLYFQSPAGFAALAFPAPRKRPAEIDTLAGLVAVVLIGVEQEVEQKSSHVEPPFCQFLVPATN
jgi:hypothetical protein